MSKNVYCGAGKTPKGKTNGSVEQCIDNRQIRMYGLIEVDKQKLHIYKNYRYIYYVEHMNYI